jgi:hypothetical protein
MGGQPWVADWEHIIARDLVPDLVLAGQPRGVHRPADLTWLPFGAHADLSDGIGPTGLEDLLVVPATAWRWDRWRRQSLYTPPGVAAVGERGVALWVRALPVPGIRAQVPFSEFAAVEQRADGPWRVLIVTGRAGKLVVRCHQDAAQATDAWTRRLRLRAAPVPAPVPPSQAGGRGPDSNRDREAFLLAPGDEIVQAGRAARPGRGPCLVAVTSRELVIVQSSRKRGRPWGWTTRTLYVPRASIEDATVQSSTVQSSTVLVHSAGTEMRVVLRSRKVAAAASYWLQWLLSQHDRGGTGSHPAQPGGG